MSIIRAGWDTLPNTWNKKRIPMPKEITHFALARCLGRAVPETSLFYTPIKNYPRLFTLGAVTPDIPFYYLAGPGRERVQALSQPFHRTCSRALLPVLKFLSRNRSEPALALAAGVICHLVSDTQFHPLVYYYAGMDGVHKGATARHRLFETAMDLHFYHLYPGETRLDHVVKSVEISKQALGGYLAGLFALDSLPIKAVGHSLNWHRGIQSLFLSPGIKKSMAWFSQKGRPLPDKITSLVYPFREPVCLDFFSQEIHYQDPCTREKVSTTLLTIVDQTLESALTILSMVSNVMALSKNQRHSLEGLVSDPTLPRIRPGLPVSTFTTWLGTSDLRPVLYPGSVLPF
ncbi:MAG: zinc dependent phospholipase C family protein [Desulfobacter sp.]|nr:zinc dependent phospholipase C family protein [Desulfobacter sp.]WDP84172.1 MAG: zinc dependent phospholipase C family protein [Desulfobacter sp.]